MATAVQVFFRRQLAADQQRIGHSPGHGFGTVCVNDADHHRHLQLAGVFDSLTGKLMQLVSRECPGLGALGASGEGDPLAARQRAAISATSRRW